ncbi:MAG TPA: hypothetical protein VG943_02620 [Caulobacterales bacterium]|nr:hypothetical protein [Caulobacterales bacterium]
MNWARIQCDWHEFSGRIQNRWGRLTDDDLHLVRAGRENLIACVQSRYRIEWALAEAHVDGWLRSFH